MALDIPGTILAYNHAGATGPIVGGVDAIATEDGDGSYVEYQGGGLTGGTAGYALWIGFPPTTLPGPLVSTSLVIQSKGYDSRTSNVPYDVANFGEVLTPGPVVQLSNRLPDPDYHTGPDYGYIDPGPGLYWGWAGLKSGVGGPRGDDATTDYVETVTPLTGPNDTTFNTLPDGTEEFVDEEKLASGHVEYNPGSGLYLHDSFRGNVAHPSASAVIRYSYIALRVEYAPPFAFGAYVGSAAHFISRS